MATSVRMIAVIALAMIAFVPTAATAHAPKGPWVGDHPATGAEGVFNFSTPSSSDITLVAISPDGKWVAAATGQNAKTVYVFSSAQGSSGAIAPTTTISLPADASALAISETSPSGTPTLILGVEGWVLGFPVTSNTPIWNFTGYYVNGTATITGVAISNSGTDVAAVADYFPSSSPTQGLFSYTYFNGSKLVQWYNGSSLYIPDDISMTADGSRTVVGVTSDSSVGYVYLFDATGGSPQTWTDLPSPTSSGGALHTAQIAGNGVAIYAASDRSLTAMVPGSTVAPVDSFMTAADLLSVSSDGCNALASEGSYVDYFNVSASGSVGCTASSFVTSSLSHAAWNASFPSTITSLSMATGNPDYFVVAWSNELAWYYAYPGLPFESSVAYRTLTTNGDVTEIATSDSGGVTSVGSAFLSGSGGDEFTIAQDSGIPQYAPLTVTATQVSSSAGATSATENISWSAPPTNGFTEIQIGFSPSSGAAAVTTPSVTNPAQTSVLVSGFSFNAQYTVTLNLISFGGAESTPSSGVSFTTAGAPPVTDPFMYFEYGAIAVIAAGAVTYVVLASKLPKNHPPAPAPMAPRPVLQYPPRSGPPGPPPQAPPGGNPGGQP